MKKLTMILATVLGISLQSMAHGYGYSYVNSYADAIVFDEMGVTFSVYPDGEFDFYLDNGCQPNTISNGYVNVTFNSGYNYDPFVQYDDYGAVIQVENVPIFYDWYGRVSQIGDVVISYRNRRVCQVGGLYLHYNSYGHYAYHTGFINVWNPYFVYRPFYVAFARPTMCFVHVNPYRQYYRPVRYTYYRPYVRNIRPHYATIGHTYSPSGNVVTVHHRYSQTAGRGEVAVVRDRRKITAADAGPRPSTVRDARTNDMRNNASTYSRSAQTSKPADVRSSASRSTRPTTSVRTTTSKPVQTAPSRTSSSSRTTTAAKPAATVGRTATTSSRTGSVQSSGRTTSSPRTVSPSSATRTQPAQRSTSNRSGSATLQTVKPQTSSRSSAVKPSTSTRSSSGVSRSSSAASPSKSSSAVKSGGKVSVGSRSSKSGR